jgi:hypothetical protein
MNNKKKLFLIHETQKNLIKSAKARATGTIPRVYHNVTISMKKFFITNPLILEEQNSFKFIGT